jgi:hypothetical protein
MMKWPDKLYRYCDEEVHAEAMTHGSVWISTLRWVRAADNIRMDYHLPIRRRAGPVGRDVTKRGPDQLGGCVVARKVAARLGDSFSAGR